MRFFHNFSISQPIKLKFGTGTQNWMLILIMGSKSGFGDDFGQYDTKTVILRHFLAKMPLRNSVAMATPKIPDDQKLFERVCYTLKLKVTKFSFLDVTVSELYLKNQLGEGRFAPHPVQNRVKNR